MNFGGDEDDSDFGLTGAARSRLSSLFHGQEPTEVDPNQALIFTAPKQPQPKKQDQPAATEGQLKLLHAVAVHTYVLESGKYSSQGQAGAAILGKHDSLQYQLLLYKGKQQKITSCSINANFSYRVQENNYANFYDDRKVNWSIMFDSDKSSMEFAKKVALAKASSCGNSLNSTIIQDLTAGEGPMVLENGGTAEVLFTGWIFSNHTLGEVFDSNTDLEKPFRFKMGKSKVVKGWSGLLGSKNGTRRLVIIPPAFAYGSEGVPNKIPPNAVVAYEFYIKKVKEPKDSSSLSQSPAKVESEVIDKRPEISPKPHSQSINDETIRMRGASISEQLMQSPRKGNATIISRMAKMGTATLPFPGAVAAQPSSESEPEDDYLPKSDPPTPPIPAAHSRESSPKPVPKPRTSSGSGAVTQPVHPMPVDGGSSIQVSHIASTHHSQPIQQIPLYATASVHSQQPLMSNTFPLQVYPQATSHAAYPVMQQSYATHPLPAMSPTVMPSMAESHLSMLLTETRSQNTEVRFSLSKITDKVETVLQKVENISSQSGGHGSQYMESNVLVQNIQRIVQENTRLKGEVEDKNSKIHSLNEKICDLLQKSQRFFEESNSYLEQRTETSVTQSKLISLEQEKAKLASEVSDALAKITALRSDLENSKQQECELREKISGADSESTKQMELVDGLKNKYSEQKNKNLSLQTSLKEVEQEKKDLLQKVLSLGRKMTDLELIKKTLEKTVSEKEIEIKKIKERSENDLRNFRDSYEGKEFGASEESKKLLEQLLNDKEDLQKKLDELQRGYDLLQGNSSKQTERYEGQIHELKNRIRQLIAQASKHEPSSSHPSSEADFDIKKTMNILYRLLQGKIQASESYAGDEVLKISLEVIRGLTLRLLTQKQKQQSASQLENSSDSPTPSASAEDQTPEDSSVSASPSKTVDSSHSSVTTKAQGRESSLTGGSPPKLNSSPHSDAQKGSTLDNNFQVSKDTESSAISIEPSGQTGSGKETVPAENHNTSKLAPSVQHQNIDSTQTAGFSTSKTIENSQSNEMTNVRQDVEDRKTPDQQFDDTVFASEHAMEADTVSKSNSHPNGPGKVL